MARVLVTRPADAARSTVAIAEAAGHEVLLAPVLSMRSLPISARPTLEHEAQAILVTSRHAASAAVRFGADLPLYCVGKGTARALEALGRKADHVASGDGVSLAALIVDRLDPGAGALLHPTGMARAEPLEKALAARGFLYHPWPVYAADAVDFLPEPVVVALADGAVDAVTMHSPRSGRLFMRLLAKAALSRVTADLVLLALSANVAAALADLTWRDVRIAARPDECGMAALLEELDH